MDELLDRFSFQGASGSSIKKGEFETGALPSLSPLHTSSAATWHGRDWRSVLFWKVAENCKMCVGKDADRQASKYLVWGHTVKLHEVKQFVWQCHGWCSVCISVCVKKVRICSSLNGIHQMEAQSVCGDETGWMSDLQAKRSKSEAV